MPVKRLKKPRPPILKTARSYPVCRVYSILSCKLILIIIATTLLLTTAGCAPENEILHAAEMKLLNSEEEFIPADMNLQWQPLSLPALFRNPDSRTGRFSHMWIRMEFIIPAAPDRFTGIHLGRVYHSDRTFVNGIMVGSHSLDKMKAVHATRNYSIPSGILKQGRNIIHINYL